MDEQEISEKLKQILPEKRFHHSMQVMETAQRLAGRYGGDRTKIRLAALLHDCSRYMTGEEMILFLQARSADMDPISKEAAVNLLHARVSMYLAMEEYQINDPDILSAIDCHTLGKYCMSLTDKIIFISDYIEPGRDFTGVDRLRELAESDLDMAIVEAVNSTLIHLLNENRLIHPMLLDARNGILARRKDPLAKD